MSYMFTRKELYNLVWSEPMLKLAKRYEISDVGLSKVCRQYDVPRPPRGYWNKLAAGKPVKKTLLPDRGPGMEDEITVGGGYYHYRRPIFEEELLDMDLTQEPEFAQRLEEVRKRSKVLTKTLKFETGLSKVHTKLRPIVEEEESRIRAVAAGGYVCSWNKPRLSSSFEKRRFEIINMLFTAASNLGFSIGFYKRDINDLSITVNQTKVSFSIDAENCQTDRFGERILVTDDNAKMQLVIGGDFEGDIIEIWEIPNSQNLDSRVSKIFQEIIVAAEVKYRNSILHHHEWLIKRKADLIEEIRERKERQRLEEIERQKQLEKARVDNLLSDADRFRKANEIREYVSQVLQIKNDEETRKWGDWAISVADTIDPVLNRSYMSISGTDES